MSSKKANNNPGLCPVKGQKSGLCSRTETQNQFSSLSLSSIWRQDIWGRVSWHTKNEYKYIILNKQTDALIIQIYSVIKLYMFRASSLPIIKEFFTEHLALVSFMQVFMTVSKQSQDGLCLETVIKHAWKLPMPNVQ
jgi:hypothetical protein